MGISAENSELQSKPNTVFKLKTWRQSLYKHLREDARLRSLKIEISADLFVKLSMKLIISAWVKEWARAPPFHEHFEEKKEENHRQNEFETA